MVPAPVLVNDPGVIPLQHRREVMDAAPPRPGEAESLRADRGEVRLGRAVDPVLWFFSTAASKSMEMRTTWSWKKRTPTVSIVVV
eukprot:CAMPEP_0168396578 /NCGR_PEP_ID=MMETSP0228-20121227/20625_1 /TAXON_ID=133427 /ORGANISM="Protoceratium reticulatum, Strain CCCM 535 (=CCMP 1889)" /LENGTH=84 /DNA_ID=CAMNT_0008410033 /DNA_START=23 /DNA_END=275 /DNA_ORIENTATION=+